MPVWETLCKNISLLLGWNCPHGRAGRVHCHEGFLMMLVMWVWRPELKDRAQGRWKEDRRGCRKGRESVPKTEHMNVEIKKGGVGGENRRTPLHPPLPFFTQTCVLFCLLASLYQRFSMRRNGHRKDATGPSQLNSSQLTVSPATQLIKSPEASFRM